MRSEQKQVETSQEASPPTHTPQRWDLRVAALPQGLPRPEWLRWQNVSINWWVSTQNAVDAHNGTGFGHIKKKKVHTHYNMTIPEDIMLSDGARCERPHILLWDSICTKRPKHANPQTESRWCLPEAVCGGRGHWEWVLMGTGLLLWVMEMFWNSTVGMTAQTC